MGPYNEVTQEEALAARIISQARAIYGPKYPLGSTFDVIYSCDGRHKNTVSWVIVYPQPEPAVLKARKAVSNDWVPVLKSPKAVPRLQDAYWDLIAKLRVIMVDTMATKGKWGSAKFGERVVQWLRAEFAESEATEKAE